MGKKEILNLAENQYLINAFQLYEKHYGSDQTISELKIRYKNLFDSYITGIISTSEYREKKIGLSLALYKYISEVEVSVETPKINVMNINIQNQNISGQAFMADTINMGNNNVVFDKADTELIKYISNSDVENKEQVINAISEYNKENAEPIQKAKSKNKIVSFLTDNCIPVLKALGKASLAIILTKYGMKLADLGLED